MSRQSMYYALMGFCVLLLACGGNRPPSAAETLAPQLTAEAPISDVLEVRTLRVLWSGTGGATSRITRSEDDALDRARTLSVLLRAPGSNFGEVARQYGDVPPTVDRLERGDALPQVFSAASELRVGQVSSPIRTDEGYLVITRRSDPLPGPTTLVARHILVSYEGARRAQEHISRTREQARELADDVREDVLGGADWIALHREYSDEPANPNGPPGGQLPEFQRGQMVPAFERVAFLLEVGETSEIVETPFGFHVIQRIR